ncbi:sensor histidine kinase [Paenibacillus sp. MBLB4367]|uniref:cache domain-containing sensor histidine kinase n=1 Tax=Paenibacillus sp. MBLB4367 TaxID=3384767 RepID=UPI003908132E
MRNPFKVFSFHYTFFFTFLFFSLFFILLIGMASYAITNQETVKQTIQARKLLLSEINKQLMTQMQAIEYDSLAISSNPKLINYLQNAGESYDRLQQKRDILDQISRLSYIKDGIHSVQLFSESIDRPEGIGTNGLFNSGIIQQYAWYDQIVNADSCWVGAHQANPGQNESGDNRVVSFARKIESLSGKEVGILVINMKLSYMNQLIANIAPGDSRYILDSYDRLITEIVGSGMGSFAANNERNQMSNVLDKSNQEEYAISRNNRKMLLIWNKQSSSDWVLMDAIAWDNVTKASRQIKNVIVLAVFGCIVLAVGMALLLAYQFVQPIRRLIQVVGQIKNGKLDVQIKNDYQNEFGKLNEHVNLMVRRIRQLLTEVDDQNRKKREAELQMLQEQINPHFIYNTLDTINWQAIEYGAHNISKMLSLLGKMLRLGLSKGSAFITIRSEMDYLQCYIELQMIRFQNEITISLSVPESTYSYLVPKLMLQPFIENALIHGMERGKGGEIVIVVSENETDLWFTIADTGKGMDSKEHFTNGKMKGSGIRNVRERIHLYFGESYGVDIQSNRSTGTTVKIKIPKVSPAYPESGEGHSC